MEVSFEIKYHSAVSKDIKKINSPDKIRIKKAIENKLVQNPEKYAEHLRGELKNYWKLRVGDYRVVFKVGSKELLVLAIAHRKEIYKRFK